jgi:hypothetical protein
MDQLTDNLVKILDNVMKISFKIVCCYCVVCTAIAFVAFKGRWLKEVLAKLMDKTDPANKIEHSKDLSLPHESKNGRVVSLPSAIEARPVTHALSPRHESNNGKVVSLPPGTEARPAAHELSPPHESNNGKVVSLPSARDARPAPRFSLD